MSDKDLNFDKIWGANGDINYDFTDDNYLTGWDFIGNVPPARGMFNRLQHDTDRKQKYLNDQLKALSIKQYTVNDATMPTGNTGLPDTLFSGIGNRIKNITGENDWKAAPAATLSELKKNLAAFESKNYTVNDANAPTGNTALVDVLLSGIGNRLKNITGESDWKTAPATNLATLATLASNLASAADVTWSGKKFTNAKLGITGLMEQNGYICFGPNFGGLILQWGLESSNAFRGTVTYPIQFPNTVWCTFLNDPGSDPEAIQGAQIVRDVMPYSKTGFQFFERQVADNSGLACDQATAFWLSIGY